MTQTIYGGKVGSELLPAGHVLSVTLDAGAGAQVQRIYGGSVVEAASLSASTTYGPYLHDMQFRVSALAGATVTVDAAPNVAAHLNATQTAAAAALVSGAGNVAAFSQTIDLTGAQTVMAQATVGGALTFVPAAEPRLFGSCHARLVANGSNVPSFAAFVEFGSSAGYDNTSGIINHLDFWWDGVTYWYAVQQAANAVPVTIPAVSSAIIASATPTQIVVVFSAALNVGSVPAASAFTIANTGGADVVTAVAVSGSTLTLTKSRTTGSGDTVTLSYTAPASSPLVSTDGVGVGSFASQAVNNQLATQFVRLGTPTLFTESGSAGVGWTYTATSTSLGGVIASNSDKALAGDGYFQAKMTGATATSVFFLDDANDTMNFSGNVFGVQTQAPGSPYMIVSAGNANQAANGTAVNVADNDLLRLERVGTTGYVRVSKDSGATWTLLHTRTGITTATLYPKFNGGPAGVAWGPLIGFAVA